MVWLGKAYVRLHDGKRDKEPQPKTVLLCGLTSEVPSNRDVLPKTGYQAVTAIPSIVCRYAAEGYNLSLSCNAANKRGTLSYNRWSSVQHKWTCTSIVCRRKGSDDHSRRCGTSINYETALMYSEFVALLGGGQGGV